MDYAQWSEGEYRDGGHWEEEVLEELPFESRDGTDVVAQLQSLLDDPYRLERLESLRIVVGWKEGMAPWIDAIQPGPAHKCRIPDDLEYRGSYAAPGYGQSWECKVCKRTWAKVGANFHDPADQVHILQPEDVR